MRSTNAATHAGSLVAHGNWWKVRAAGKLDTAATIFAAPCDARQPSGGDSPEESSSRRTAARYISALAERGIESVFLTEGTDSAPIAAADMPAIGHLQVPMVHINAGPANVACSVADVSGDRAGALFDSAAQRRDPGGFRDEWLRVGGDSWMTNTMPIRERIVGTWDLVEYSMASDNDVHYPLGPDARGLIMYTPGGFMSAQLMTPERPPFRAPYVHGGESDELIIAARGYLAYSGPFHVDEETRTVHHVTTVSLFPNWVGSDRQRIVRFDSDDAMTLSTPPFEFRGTSWSPAVVWRRAT